MIVGDRDLGTPCDPAGPTPRPDLEPRVARAGGSAYPWRIVTADAQLCWAGGWRTKREAAAALAGLGDAGRRQWLAGAYEALWTAGRLAADDPGEAGRACGPWDREPVRRQHPDDEHPDWALCGRPIVFGDLWDNAAHALARLRLGWTKARASAAYVAAAWSSDREQWYTALARACADLSAGISDEEAARLGVPERLRPYLRLDHARELGRYVHDGGWPWPRTVPARVALGEVCT